MSFKDIIKAANQPPSEPESQNTGMPADKETSKEKMVNITVKVPESHRNHWAVESAKRRLPVAQVVKRALADEFGLPNHAQD